MQKPEYDKVVDTSGFYTDRRIVAFTLARLLTGVWDSRIAIASLARCIDASASALSISKAAWASG
jgi:hypothetical protein